MFRVRCVWPVLPDIGLPKVFALQFFRKSFFINRHYLDDTEVFGTIHFDGVNVAKPLWRRPKTVAPSILLFLATEE
jgi:hypothetical protein